jgi:hypothetical protein
MSYFEKSPPFFVEAEATQTPTKKVIDFQNYKFRPSGLGRLMAGALTEKEADRVNVLENKEKLTQKERNRLIELYQKRDKGLSDGAKTYLEEIFIEEFFGRKQIVSSFAMEKGTNFEPESIALFNQFIGFEFSKNEQTLENSYLKGTPDIISKETVIDIKTSRDIFSFFKAGMTSLYKYQLIAYCILTGKPRAKLAYCLINNPASEIKRQSYFVNPEDVETIKQIEANNIYDDIDLKYRIKVFDLDFDLETEQEKIESKIKLARLYLQGILNRYLAM